MMKEIRKILLADQPLMSIVNEVVPSPTKRIDNVIIYEVSPISDDGIKRVSRVKLTTVCDAEEQWAEASERISELLVTTDDRPLTKKILSVSVNGGGSLYDSDREKYHKIIYLNITTRSKKL